VDPAERPPGSLTQLASMATPPRLFDAEVSPVATPVVDTVAIASRLSRTYHTSPDCVDAQRIKPANRIEGDEARRGRIPHDGCPRR
jgi:hypothetical protein